MRTAGVRFFRATVFSWAEPSFAGRFAPSLLFLPPHPTHAFIPKFSSRLTSDIKSLTSSPMHGGCWGCRGRAPSAGERDAQSVAWLPAEPRPRAWSHPPPKLQQNTIGRSDLPHGFPLQLESHHLKLGEVEQQGAACLRPVERRGPSRQHLQLKQLCSLVEPTVVAGEAEGQGRGDVQLPGSSELQAVVGAQGKPFRQSTCGLHKRLADLDDAERWPGCDQPLAGPLKSFAADGIFPLPAGQPSHRFRPGDPTDRDDVRPGTDLLHLIGMRLKDEQLDQGAGVAEQDHPLKPDLRAPCHSRVSPRRPTSREAGTRASGHSS
jgi:hypothetical protein